MKSNLRAEELSKDSGQTSTAELLENLRFKSKYRKLADDLNDFSGNKPITQEKGKRNLISLQSITSQKGSYLNNLRNCKLDIFINNNSSKKVESNSRVTSASKIVNRAPTIELTKSKINLDNIKLNSEIKYKYNNIIESIGSKKSTDDPKNFEESKNRNY